MFLSKKLIKVIIALQCVLLLSGCVNYSAFRKALMDDTEPSSTVSVFDGDSGINASAEISNNIINFPELEITIRNMTDKEISAIKFYAVPQDVYGEKITSWKTENRLKTDEAIAAGETTTISYQLIDQSVDMVTLYVYSVYFSDGTEWGDRDAAASTIIAQAPTINVNNTLENPGIKPVTSNFEGDCGFSASAELCSDIIGYPEVNIKIKNTSEKDISAIKFYVVPYDVYGEEIEGFMVHNNFIMDSTISVGESKSCSWNMYEGKIKTVKLYVYSVYFADGTSWGDKDAIPQSIIDSAPTIDVTVNLD